MTYSSINDTFIHYIPEPQDVYYFEKKFPPARSYFGLHVYWFWEKFPPARIFHLARLLVFSFALPIFIVVCKAEQQSYWVSCFKVKSSLPVTEIMVKNMRIIWKKNSILQVYWFWNKNPPANLLNFQKNLPLHVYSVPHV